MNIFWKHPWCSLINLVCGYDHSLNESWLLGYVLRRENKTQWWKGAGVDAHSSRNSYLKNKWNYVPVNCFVITFFMRWIKWHRPPWSWRKMFRLSNQVRLITGGKSWAAAVPNQKLDRERKRWVETHGRYENWTERSAAFSICDVMRARIPYRMRSCVHEGIMLFESSAGLIVG
jgi:hypothetical protein